MKYGKLNGTALELAPTRIKVSGKIIASPRASDYKKAGYLPVDPTYNPPEGYKWADQWEEKGGKIVKKYVEIPQEEQEYISHMVILDGDEAAAYEEAKDVIDALEEVFG